MREDYLKKSIHRLNYLFLLLCKGLTIDDVGVSRDTVFQEIRPGAGLKTGDVGEEKLGGVP